MTDPTSESSADRVGAATWARLRGAQAAASTLSMLRRLVPIAHALVGVVLVLVIVELLSALLLVLSYLILLKPSTPIPFIFAIVLFASLALPGFVLWLFRNALKEVLALPNWLRTSPEFVRDHGGELADILRSEEAGTADGGRSRVFRDVPRAGKLLLEAHKDLPEYGGALRLINIPFLIAVAFSLGATIFLAVMASFIFLLAIAIGIF